MICVLYVPLCIPILQCKIYRINVEKNLDCVPWEWGDSSEIVKKGSDYMSIKHVLDFDSTYHIPPVCVLTCVIKLPFTEKRLSQNGHVKGFSPVCVLM